MHWFKVTTSNGVKCCTDLKRLSAAVAQVSGIIALGLQAKYEANFYLQLFTFLLALCLKIVIKRLFVGCTLVTVNTSWR
jgi:hypothetical protein